MTSKIYIITNDINDKVYIGKTTLPTVEDRFRRHKIDSHKERLERMAKRRIASLPRKAIEQYYPDGSYFQSFESIADAARWIAENRDSNKKVSHAHIGEAAKDFSKVRYGHRWKFKE